MPQHVAVVIPYYQRTRGLLSRSLRGVFEQQDAPPTCVIIVDDDSPLSADEELSDIDAKFRESISVIRQANQGCAAARNTGLAAVLADAGWIALLDSDDLWTADHLRRAATALETQGAFYFADGGSEGSETTQYRQTGFVAGAHRSIHEYDDLFVFVGDFLSLLIDRTPLVSSSVVYRRDAFGDLRFEPHCGLCEDLAFWTSVASRSPAVVFSSRTEVIGSREGEHISHINDWKSNRSLRLTRDFLRCYNFILGTVPLSASQRARIEQKAVDRRISAIITALAMIKGRISVDRGLMLDVLRESPAPVADFFRAAARLIKLRRA